MAMVGHKTEAIHRRYAIVDSATLRDAIPKLDAAGRDHKKRSQWSVYHPLG